MSDYNLGTKLDELHDETVTIGGSDYRLVDGNTLLDLSANIPSAATAATAVGMGVYYVAIDTKVISQSDGINWVVI